MLSSFIIYIPPQIVVFLVFNDKDKNKNDKTDKIIKQKSNYMTFAQR